jgi:hypothetical protein
MHLLIDFVSFVLNAIFIGTLVWFAFTWAVARHLESSHVDTIVQDLDKERLIPLTVEVDLDQYFCYNSITKAFVCQGRNLKEIVERFRLRYPDKAAAIYDGDETAVRTLKHQLKELGENFSSIGRAS